MGIVSYYLLFLHTNFIPFSSNFDFIFILTNFQAKPLLKKNDIMELIDPSLAGDFDSRQMNLMLLAASLCIQQSSIRRPSTRQARSLYLFKSQRRFFCSETVCLIVFTKHVTLLNFALKYFIYFLQIYCLYTNS